MNGRPSGTVTFLATDIEGSTRLWQEHHAAMKAAVAAHDRLVRTAIESHGGYVFSTGGDSFWAAFTNPVDAALAALDSHQAMAGYDWGEVGDLRVRAAVDTGLADERDGDYFGPPLNRASRIIKHAKGGETLCSSTTADLLKHDLPSGYAVARVGRRRLPDMENTEVLYRISEATDTIRRVGWVPAVVAALVAIVGLGWWAMGESEDGNNGGPEVAADTTSTTTAAVPSPVLWTTEVGLVEVPPVVVGGVVAVAVNETEPVLLALDAETGSVAWQRTDLGVVRQLATEGSFLYVTSAARLDVLNPSDGSQIPRCGFSLPAAGARTAVETDAIYILSTGAAYRVENHPGADRCHGPRIEDVRFIDSVGYASGPAISGDFMLAGDTRGLYLFAKADMTGIWKPPRDLAIPEVRPDGIALVAVDIETRSTIRTQPVIAAVDEDGVLSLFHPGADPAQIDLPLTVVTEGSTPLATPDAVIIQQPTDELTAIDPLTGSTLWTTPLTGVSALATDGDLAFIGTAGSVVAYTARTGQTHWTITDLPQISALTVTPSLLAIVSADDQTISLAERPDRQPTEPLPPISLSVALQDPETTARQFFEAWTEGNAEAMSKLLGVHAVLRVTLPKWSPDPNGGWKLDPQRAGHRSMWMPSSEEDLWLWFDHDAYVGTTWTVGDCTTTPANTSGPAIHRVECEGEVTDTIITTAGDPPTTFTAILDIDNGVVSFIGESGEVSSPSFHRWLGTYFTFGTWLSSNFSDEFSSRCVPELLGIPCAELHLDHVDEWAATLDQP